MRPVVIGGLVALLIVGAFAIGMTMQDADSEGPGERLGSALDEAAGDLQRGVEDAAD